MRLKSRRGLPKSSGGHLNCRRIAIDLFQEAGPKDIE
jgi:hypothetical protein